jgi:hypothetical protein
MHVTFAVLVLTEHEWIDDAQNLCQSKYYKRSILSVLDRTLPMKRRPTPASLCSMSHQSPRGVAHAVYFDFEALTGIVCRPTEGRTWDIFGGLYPDPSIQSGRCVLAPL